MDAILPGHAVSLLRRAACRGLFPALLVAAGAAAREPAADTGQVDAGSDAPKAEFYSTATVRERPLAAATAAVSVLDREAIESLGVRTAGEALRFVPGVTVTGAGRGGLTTARIRGGDPNFTLVLVDGVPVNDPTYQVGGAFDFAGLPAAAIERIEVVRGPLSAFYGSTGLAGAIHIFTRRGRAGPPRFEVELEGGDGRHAALDAAISGSSRRVDYFLGVTAEVDRRQIAEESMDLGHLQGRLHLPLGDRSTLRLTTRLASWDADDYPEASGGPVLGSGELRRSRHREASLGLELASGGAWRHEVKASVYRHDLDRDSPAILPRVPAASESTGLTRTRLGWALTLPRRSPTSALQASVGADVERQEGSNDSVLLLPLFLGGEVSGDYLLSRTTPGLFVELVAGRGNLVLELGGRVDDPQGAGVQWSPRAGLSFRPGGGATRLRASAGRSFKLPSFFALASPPQLGGNPDLQPEVMVGGDVAFERRFSPVGLVVELAFFYSRFRDLVDFDFEAFTHVNRSRVEARGWELRLGWQPGERLAVEADATWQEVTDRETGFQLRERPRTAGGLRLDWRPRPGLALHLDGRWMGAVPDELIPVPGRRSVDGHLLLGASGSWRLTPAWQLRGRLDNLLDESYETAIGFPGPGRAIRVSLRYARGGGEE